MKYSEQLNKLAAALAKAQGEMENAIKGSLNPHFRSKYADLGSIWDAIRAPLSKHGLSVIQLPDMDETGVIRVSTMLIHSSGQFIEASYALPAMKNDAQGYGSAITYMKRYALTGMGVAPEDDDGNAASKGEILPQGEAAPQPNPKTIATKWADEMREHVLTAPFKSLKEFDEWHTPRRDKIASVRAHNEAAHKRLIEAIQKKQADLTPLGVG